MHHHGPECHASRLVCCLQVQGHRVRDHMIRCDCFYHIDSTADLFATKFNWMIQHHKLGCFVHTHKSCFQGLSHSEGSKLKLLITKYTDSSTLTYSITRHTKGGWGGILPRKATNPVFEDLIISLFQNT